MSKEKDIGANARFTGNESIHVLVAPLAKQTLNISLVSGLHDVRSI